jgi:dipeptidyl aminopeptidase/acylaminoacyl peptidase
MNKYYFFLCMLLFSANISGQKKPLDQNAFDGWKSIGASSVSDDGKWVTWELNPQQGDGWLYLYNVQSGRLDSAFCGFKAAFSPDCRYLVYQVKPALSETRQGKKKKLKEDQMPKNSLAIRLLPDGRQVYIRGVKSFNVPESGSNWMAYLLEKRVQEKKESQAAADSSKAAQPASVKGRKPPEPKGTELVIFNPVSGREFRYQDVTEYVVAQNGMTIGFIQDIPDTTKIDEFRANVFDMNKETSSVMFEGKGSAKKIISDKSGKRLSFIYSADTSKVKVYDLYLWSGGDKAAKIVDASNPSMPSGWSVSENGDLTFSEDGSRLFFGTAVRPVKEPEDTLLADEKYKLDIWSWNDQVLQPMQKKQLEQELKRTYQAVYQIEKGAMFQLADKEMPSVKTMDKGNNEIALGSSDLKYRMLASWDANSYADYYIVNVKTGARTLVLEKAASRVSMSPTSKYLVYWDIKGKEWISIAISSGTRKEISSAITFPLYDELHDTPGEPAPYGIDGWTDDAKHVLIRDRYDIWLVDLNGAEAPVNITNGFGRKNNITFQYQQLDRDALFIKKMEPMYLSAFDNTDKESGFYFLKAGGASDPARLIMDKCSFAGGIVKAKKADKIIWRKGSFSESQELYLSDLTFKGASKLSVSNPQQSAYIWGTAELVEWTSFNREHLQGILYKPENFDPAKKYPMIVYFYERSSDQLYVYTPPVPSASRINIPYAVSNGYLVFVPDITYETGFPGQSCYNAVVSGTNSLLDRFSFIDRTKLGLDGQSWGGYQIAYLVTRTDLFACAYAGAAVVDMISAYGGIRWESGMSRMFQYEMDQSRIGGTLWDKPLQYIENSPIFQVPKIHTPLLLMNNDADGAVPWYQGIEFITALRRLGKPAWMLSYNDEAHNLVKRPDRKDISIRKMEFFDHYLKGIPMPYWMKYGLTQEEKGKKDGYELVEGQ